VARRLGTLENEIRSFDRLDTEYQALKRDVASNEKKVRTYLERMEEAAPRRRGTGRRWRTSA